MQFTLLIHYLLKCICFEQEYLRDYIKKRLHLHALKRKRNTLIFLLIDLNEE